MAEKVIDVTTRELKRHLFYQLKTNIVKKCIVHSLKTETNMTLSFFHHASRRYTSIMIWLQIDLSIPYRLLHS